MQRIGTDVLVVGAGAAGLFAVLHLPGGTDIVVIDKGASGTGSSPWAQGGVAAALGSDDSTELHFQDTLRVAAGHADVAAAAVLCSEAPECVLELVELGCRLDRNDSGALHLAREGGQSVARSAHAGDATGAAIMAALRKHAAPRVKRLEGSCLRLAVVDGRCVGAWVVAAGEVIEVAAKSTILGTGGIGALFSSTTNPSGATGDGHALAWDAGAGLTDVEFVQFHPTSLATGDDAQRVLITEALRGAGAHVIDAEGRRFLYEHHSDGELAPRDVVARAIASRHAWIDCRHLDSSLLEREFPTVLASCRAHGIDPVSELVPVTPAAHYAIGGIQTDLDGRTSIPRLYAVGECSSTGAHGANRLAGNSLAEALVFGRRAARAVAGQRSGRQKSLPAPPLLAPASGMSVPRLQEVRDVCSRHLGIERDGSGLAAAFDELEEAALLPPALDPRILEVRSAAVVGRLAARAAGLRTESRGVHHRRDHPDPDPRWAGVRTRLARS